MAGRCIPMPGTLCVAAAFDPLMAYLGVSVGRRLEILTRCASIDEVFAALPNDPGDEDILCSFSLGAIALLNCWPLPPQTRVEISRPSFAGASQHIMPPILAITDAEDAAMPPAKAREVAQISDSGRAVIIDSAGPFVRLERTARVADEICGSELIDFSIVHNTTFFEEVTHLAPLY